MIVHAMYLELCIFTSIIILSHIFSEYLWSNELHNNNEHLTPFT